MEQPPQQDNPQEFGMNAVPEYLVDAPNLCGSQEVLRQTTEAAAQVAHWLERSDIDWSRVRAASAVALRMHQPLIPSEQGRELTQARLVCHLKHMFEQPHLGDNHNAPIYHWCYKRIAQFVPQLRHEGASPRVMLDYSGALLHGLRVSGFHDVLDALRGITCSDSYTPQVEWLGSAWGNVSASHTPPQDFARHVVAWRHTFAAQFGLEALARVRGFAPPNMELPNHPEHAFELVSTLRLNGYQWILLPEEAVEDPASGAQPHGPHGAYRLVARNGAGEEATILALLIGPGNRNLMVGQMQSAHAARSMQRIDLGGESIPPMAAQWGPGEEGGVVMNEFPHAFRQAAHETSGSDTPMMNGGEYLEALFASGVAVDDLPIVQPAQQRAVWERHTAGAGAEVLQGVIDALRAENPHFPMNQPRRTDDAAWVAAHEAELSPAERLSARFAQVVDGGGFDAQSPAVNRALLHLLCAQEMALGGGEQGLLGEYGREIIRRGHAVLDYDFDAEQAKPVAAPGKPSAAPLAPSVPVAPSIPVAPASASPALASITAPAPLDPVVTRLKRKLFKDPFGVLGLHLESGETGEIACVRAHLPLAERVKLWEADAEMERLEGSDFFEWRGPADQVPTRYHLWSQDADGRERIDYDPYCFPDTLSAFDAHLFNEGSNRQAWRFLGAHEIEIDGIQGVRFAVWAPSAFRVSVVGEFNQWHGLRHLMRRHEGSGVWTLFIPGLGGGELYKFELQATEGEPPFLKSDPYGRAFELRPETASIIVPPNDFAWGDAAWLEQRKQFDWQGEPISIYEVHPGSWRRGDEGQFLSYRELAHALIDYVKQMGFTHVELMPITEHPFDPSWGYQATGYFAPTSRFGSPDDFRYLVDALHQNGIGVILDWVPAHFPKDQHALARFDGTALYEHADPRQGEHLDWSTLIFNYGRHEVKSFLISSAVYWLTEFHIDGLRVDAVASMLYLDYSREEWIPNRYGGRENLEAIALLRDLNRAVHQEAPGALVFAEESTAWPMVTKPGEVGGLGFNLKWNMGWMNDTLSYMAMDPVYRKHHHDQLTFSFVYAFNENFVLPLSHDEVVHGKGSLLGKMPGDEWRRFANLRALYGYMFAHPGKKLLFMGCEFGQPTEWSSSRPLPWELLEQEPHQGIQRLIADLNRFYCAQSALHGRDFDAAGFEWVESHDRDNSVIIFVRSGPEGHLVMAVNFTPVAHEAYRIGAPQLVPYREVFNTDSAYYGGGNMGNAGADLTPDPSPWMGRAQSVMVRLPPLAMIALQPVAEAERVIQPAQPSADQAE
nr:1,4-alpha-glucan branching protein GlgB [Magnetofaba australis]